MYPILIINKKLKAFNKHWETLFKKHLIKLFLCIYPIKALPKTEWILIFY